MNEDIYFSDSVYNAIYDAKINASGTIAEIWGKFDQFSYDEQNYFADIVNELENAILEFNKYFYAYDKFVRSKTKEKSYRKQDFETLLHVATKFYGDPTKCFDIYKANRLTDFDIADVSTLKIPEVND